MQITEAIPLKYVSSLCEPIFSMFMIDFFCHRGRPAHLQASSSTQPAAAAAAAAAAAVAAAAALVYEILSA
jgi:hypothetical protein